MTNIVSAIKYPAMCAQEAQPQLPENLGLLLRQVKSDLVCALERELVALGVELRFSQVHALKHLHRLGPMSAGELARSLGLDGGAMTRLLDQLEGKDYLRRKSDKQDRRALRIELTSTGETLCKQFAGCSERVLDEAQQSLSTTERAQLIDYLQRILLTLRQPN
ncbi:MAG: MarR family transcriptional regulator [Xanthomonadales bacterium]|nr:MarR family transcriptional regulator [Xanthomonadales bacterium]